MLPPEATVISRARRFDGLAKVVRVSTIAGITQAVVEVLSSGAFLTVDAADLDPVDDALGCLRRGRFDSAWKYDLRTMATLLQVVSSRSAALTAARVDMLPHQVLTADRILSAPHANHLLADDVGMGKTVEVGLLLSALSSRKQAQRVLIITPAGLTLQWQEQLEALFGIYFDIFNRDFFDLRADAWSRFPRVIASLDALKRPKRKPALENTTDWDLLIVDEAHKLTARLEEDGSVRRTQNYQLLELLREKTRILICATATPHQGDDARFALLLHLLRPDLFSQKDPAKSLEANLPRLREVMTRNRKSEVTDAQGQPIFKGHDVRSVEVTPGDDELAFLEALETYVKVAYGAAKRLEEGRQRILALVMTTFLKLAASSPAAIRSALQNRLAGLTGARRPQRPRQEAQEQDARFEGEQQEKLEELFDPSFFEEEARYLKELVERAGRLGDGRKAAVFLEHVATLRSQPDFEGGVLIFTEYRATQEMLQASLAGTYPDTHIALIHGGMGLNAKRHSVEDLRTKGGFLISTEAGGEGLNLHENCHLLFNYDLPWNPMRLQQRIGRLERYGQKRRVLVLNLHNEGTLENKLRLYLDLKLAAVERALREVQDNPEDLHESILGTLEAEVDLPALYRRALTSDDGLARSQREIDEAIKCAQQATERMAALFSSLDRFSIGEWDRHQPEVSLEDIRGFTQTYFRGRRLDEQRPGLFSLATPPHLRTSPKIAARYDLLAFDREVLKRTPGAELFTFGHRLFDALIEQTTSYAHGGLLAKRTVHAGPELRGLEGLQLNYVLAAKHPDGRETRSFDTVFIDRELRPRPEAATALRKLYSAAGLRSLPPFCDAAFLEQAATLGNAEAERLLQQLIAELGPGVMPSYQLVTAAVVRFTLPRPDDPGLPDDEEVIEPDPPGSAP
ncbi:MAG: DEAD/DEAH box helicase [Deltaproteobacteria bacterium]|nr:DEAD/DEAH box helicase [Deltaproteobacteria bacterium]